MEQQVSNNLGKFHRKFWHLFRKENQYSQKLMKKHSLSPLKRKSQLQEIQIQPSQLNSIIQCFLDDSH